MGTWAVGNTVFKSPFGVVIFLFENGNRKKDDFSLTGTFGAAIESGGIHW